MCVKKKSNEKLLLYLSFAGERYDFVLKAIRKVKSYWIKIKGLGDARSGINNYQLAILKYEGSNQKEPTTVVPDHTDFNSDGVVSRDLRYLQF